MTVSPRACLMVMGKVSVAPVELEPALGLSLACVVELLAQAAKPAVAVAASAATNVLLESTWAPFVFGK